MGRLTAEIGEEAAADYLVTLGFVILARNYAKKYGEIDIIASKEGGIRFVEVKTSVYYPNSAFPPEIRVNAIKIKKLRKICETYLRETRVSQDQPWQIDVISVILDTDRTVQSINHIENAVFEKQY